MIITFLGLLQQMPIRKHFVGVTTASEHESSAARVFATHIAHEGNPVHPELSAFAAQHGYEIAYDGFTV